MKHTSIQMSTPCEFIEITPINPLISKCVIKVCYVGEQPNRNRSVITKEVATEMAQSLPGCPIVGFYDEEIGDFLGHERELEVIDGQLHFKDITKPYGFVDLNAKVWFQKFLDDGAIEREYLMTEGWLWTSQYPECQRIITQGNNQSMELDEKTLQGRWTKDENQHPQFFIINEALISKLCVLGEETEPCFEGATIQFSLDNQFKSDIMKMMNAVTDLLNKGGNKVFKAYSVEVGCEQWVNTLSNMPENYTLHGYFENEEGAILTVVKDSENVFYSLNDDKLTALEGFNEEAQYTEEELASFKKAEDPEDDEDEEICPDCGKPKSKCVCKHSYSVEEYEALEAINAELQETITSLETEISELRNFKLNIDKKAKEEMIASFYMLSDDDKADVVANIDKYSVDEIEEKLAVICVRNKVSFTLEDEEDNNKPTTFSLEDEFDNAPAWIKSARQVANNM